MKKSVSFYRKVFPKLLKPEVYFFVRKAFPVHLSLYGTWIHSPGAFGTQDWTRHGFLFKSGNETLVTVAARLGYSAGTTTGTA